MINISSNPKLERLLTVLWAVLLVLVAVAIIGWTMQLVDLEKHKAYGECYAVTITENIVVPSIPWYSQVVPIVVGQSVSCY
jgi:hypothetical protein